MTPQHSLARRTGVALLACGIGLGLVTLPTPVDDAARAVAPSAAADDAVALTGLKVERKREPLGIDLRHPRFSWVVESDERSTAQESYRIRVATSVTALDEGDLVWDSGVVASDASYDVAYDGPALESATDYYWRVDVGTNAGHAAAGSTFRTGLFRETDWAGGAWIGNDRGDQELSVDGGSWIWTPEDTSPQAPPEPRAFRRAHESPAGREATSAEILITGDDSFRLWVNGDEVGGTQGANNEWRTARRFEVDLAADRNVFAVRTTNSLESNGTNSPAGLLAVVRIRYDDGSTEDIVTDGSWRAGHTVPPGFEQPDFDDDEWSQAAVQAPYGSGPWGSNVAPEAEVAPAPLLRKEFEIDGAVADATLFVAAGGYANASLNGAPVSEDVLSPGFTDYDDTVQYVATDVTDQLTAGTNALGMELGRGFYGMTGGNVWNWHTPPWHDEPVVRAMLHVEYADGSVEQVVTDDSWTIHDGPTVFDDLYAGEIYAASEIQEGWDSPGFDDAGWGRASVVGGPQGELVNQRQQPIRVIEELPAVDVAEPVAGTYVVKFPRVLAGWVEVTAEGDAGTEIEMRYAEKLRADGTVNQSNNGGFQAGFQTDRLILAGTGEPETWEPQFSYKGFQYVQVTGWPGDEPPPLDAFTAKAVHTDAAEIGSFDSSSEIMNRTHRAVVDTLKNNIHGIPTDTPMFEKNGWTGDAAVGAEMFMLNLDVHELFAKWIRDLHETRDENGAPLVIAPSSDQWGQWGLAQPWHSAYVLVPYWLFQYGGDRQVLEQHYDGIKAYADLEFDRSDDGVVRSNRLGDWVSPEASPAGGNAPEDTRVSGTAYLYTMLTTMQRAANLLDRPADAAHFGQRAAVVKAAFNDAYLDRAAGYYKGQSGDRGYRQTHNVLALAFGLTPDEEMAQRVADSIAADVRARGNTLNTGVLGTKYLLPVLTEHGYADLAYDLAVQTTYPSWGHMIENGATSMWEHWSPDARSLGHYFLGTVDDWFYHYVAGIRPSPDQGYRRTTIAPTVGDEVDHAEATAPTPFGPVSSRWERTERGVDFDVTVPVGVTAEVRIPADSRWAVTEGGTPVEDVADVEFVKVDDGDVVLEVGSGDYVFAVDPVLGDLGDARESAADLPGVIAGLDAPGSPAVRKWAAQVATDTATAWSSYVDGDTEAAAVAVHRALARVGDIERWTSLQVEKGRIDAAQGDAVAALTARIERSLSSASSALLGATITVETPADEWFPGSTVPVTVVVDNAGTQPLDELDVELATEPDWEITPVGDLPTSVEPGETARLEYEIAVPESASPGRASLTGTASYRFRGGSATLPVSAVLTIAAPVDVAAVSVQPTPATPGADVTVAVELTNRADRAVTGRVELALPEGWSAAAPAAYSLDAGATATVSVTATVPETVAATEFSVVARVGATDGERGVGTGRVAIATPPATSTDHVDLGNGASETAHGLTASEHSSTSPEAGLTRRYTHSQFPRGWFEFDAEVPSDGRFAVRIVETFDGARRKTYDVELDGQVAHSVDLTRTAGGQGTITHQFVVEPSAVTADGTVRVRFQDTGADYDPSVADVWIVPLD
jgi:alpha-L-rhamnosidase